MNGPISLDLEVPCSLLTQKLEQWRAQELFIERIYRICNHVHPGVGVEHEAVQLIQDLLMRILYGILDGRPQKVEDMERCMRKSLPESMCRWITQKYEANDLFSIITTRKLYERRNPNAKSIVSVFHALQTKFKEHYGYRVDDKIVLYVLSIIDYVIADILKWTGNYIKNIRKKSPTIGLEDLKVALGADQNLIELSEMLIGDGKSATVGISARCHEETIRAKDWTYKEVALNFKHEEEQYLETLDIITNVFRHCFETALGTSGKLYLNEVFGNIVEIYDLTLKIQRLLEDAIEMSDTPCVGAGLWEFCEAQEFDIYVTYMNLFKRELEEGISVVTVLKKLLNDPAYSHFFETQDSKYSITSGGKTFSLMVNYVLPSLLQAPVFHFFRYVEYTATLSCLIEVAEEKEDLRCAKTYFNGIAMRIESFCTSSFKTRLRNEQLSRSSVESGNNDHLRRILEIQRSIEAWEGDPIGYTCTAVVREGDITMVRPSSTTDTLKKSRSVTDRHIFLFDHLLVFCKVHRSAKPDKPLYKFKGSVIIRKTEIFDMDDTEEFQNVFRIQIRYSHDSFETWTLLCRTSEEKISWLTDLVTIQTASILNRMLSNFQEEEKKRYPLILPSPKQYRFAEPDTDDNIVFEDYTSSSGIPVVKHATVLKLVERLTYHLYTDNKFVRTFLTTYRSFCSPLELLQLLIERFNIPTPYQLCAVEHCGSYSPPCFFDSDYAKNGAYATVHARGFPAQITAVPWDRVEKSYHLFRKDYQRPIQLSVLRVIRQWVNQHWYDFENDPLLLANLTFFLKDTDRQVNVKNSYKDWCRNIQSCIARKTRQEALVRSRSNGSESGSNLFEESVPSPTTPRTFLPCTPQVVWHTAKKGEIDTYDLLTLHPLEIGRQITLLEFDLYRAIKPIELVGSAWTKHDKDRRSPQLLRLIEHSTMLTYWVARSIVETPSLEERVELFSRVLEIMMVLEELNNFTGFVALYSALNSSPVFRLRATWERLDREKQAAYEKFKSLCNPHWKEMIERLRSINPPCVPFFGHYLSKIFFYEEGNSTFVHNHDDELTHEQMGKENLSSLTGANRKALVSFVKCRRVAGIISDIQMYQNQPYALQVEPSIRQFFESVNPLNGFEGKEELETYMWEKSLKIEPKDTDKWDIVKPSRSSNVLKSPGIKPPKNLASIPSTSGMSNHYGRYRRSARFSTSTNNYSPGNVADGSESSRTSSSNTFVDEKHTHIGTVDVNSGQSPRYLGDNWRAPHPLVSPTALRPPPLMPRVRKQKAASTPPSPRVTNISTHNTGSGQAPPLFPRRRSPLCAADSPKDNMNNNNLAHNFNQRFPSVQKECTRFIFPPTIPLDEKQDNVSEIPSTSAVIAVPVVPPRKKGDMLPPPLPLDAVRTIWNGDAGVETDDKMDIKISKLSLDSGISPPPLYPRRSTGRYTPPPPRPPKKSVTSRNVAAENMFATEVTKVLNESPTPPPLPPKTYRLHQRH